ncbi:MAG: 3'-5' exonuclease [Chitinophagaceae bacterium]|nr:3'-5' exonuclease [Chitinophagaceae bacterium]
MDFVAIDFETANELSTSACELGIVVVRNYKVVETRSLLIQPPDLRFNPFNTMLHGIGVEQVADQPDFKTLWPELIPYFENQLVIAHNAGFDLHVLRSLLLHYQLPFKEIPFTCSIKIAKKVWKEHQRYGLKTLTKILGIQLEHHRAESDAKACAQISIMAFHENQVSITEEITSKLNIYLGSISPEKLVSTRNKPELIKRGKRYYYRELQ